MPRMKKDVKSRKKKPLRNKNFCDYNALLEISKAMIAEKNLESLLAMIMREITRVMNAERSTLFLVDKNTKEIWSHVAQKAEIEEVRLSIGKGIAEYVGKTGKTLNIQNVHNDRRFRGEIDGETGYHTKSVLCMAIFNHENEIIGVMEALNKKKGYFTKHDEGLLAAFSSHAAIALENAVLQEETDHFLKSFIKTLAAAIDARDPVTAGHSDRVTYYSMRIGEALKLSSKNMRILEIAAILHDVGKIGIKDSILTKPGRYTKKEYEKMKEHALFTKQILDKICFSDKDKNIPLIAATHHETIDGKGYPFGLKRLKIPLLSRIIAVADVYDAMVSYDRPYKRAMSTDEAINILEKESGKGLDKKIVDVFIKKKLYIFDRRNYVRINVELAIEYKVLLPKEQDKIYRSSKLFNVSAGGLVFISDKFVPVSSFVMIWVYLVDLTLDLMAKVIRVEKLEDGNYRIAICFVNLSRVVTEKLSKYLVRVLSH